MTTFKITTVRYAIGALVLGLAVLQATVKAQEPSGGGRLAGTWDATVTIRNCASGDAILSFLSTANFNQGGTFSGITSGTSPTLRTSERGVWKHVNGNLYRFRFKAYLYNAAAVAFAYQVITHDVELDKDNLNYNSVGTTQTFALDGTPMSVGCSSAVGTRMVLE
jgi:hypothetical protein